MKSSRGVLRRMTTSLFVLFFFAIFPQITFAQYVPVKDDELIGKIDTFSGNFDDYVTSLFNHWDETFGPDNLTGTTDNLRDLISGSNPGGIAKDLCFSVDNRPEFLSRPDPSKAWAYGTLADGSIDPDQTKWGPWAHASASSTGNLPNVIPAGSRRGDNKTDGPFVQVNGSHSLRCLLQEIVEWQKLSLSIEIHSLLKVYIADAQSAQLTKQLKNRVTAANLKFAKAGNQVVNNGSPSSAPVFVTNYNDHLNLVKGRQTEALGDVAAADPLAPGPQGSLGICQPWRVDTAANMLNNSRTQTSDPFKYTSDYTACNLTSAELTKNVFATEGAYQNFSDNLNDPASTNGGLFTLNHMINNPQDTPLGAQTVLDEVAYDRISRQEESTKAEAQNSGFLPTKACSGDPADPHCLDAQYSLAINPGGQNQGNINNLTQQLNNEITSGSLDSQNSATTTRTPTDINTNSGLMGADTLALETSPTAVNRLVQEFYDTIRYGYFGIQGSDGVNAKETKAWAQSTMLNIYDEMKFNDDLTNGQGATVVPEDTDPIQINY